MSHSSKKKGKKETYTITTSLSNINASVLSTKPRQQSLDEEIVCEITENTHCKLVS